MKIKDIVLTEVPEGRPLRNNMFRKGARRFFEFNIQSVVKEENRWMVKVSFQNARNRLQRVNLPVARDGSRLFVSLNRGAPKDSENIIFVSVYLT